MAVDGSMGVGCALQHAVNIVASGQSEVDRSNRIVPGRHVVRRTAVGEDGMNVQVGQAERLLRVCQDYFGAIRTRMHFGKRSIDSFVDYPSSPFCADARREDAFGSIAIEMRRLHDISSICRGGRLTDVGESRMSAVVLGPRPREARRAQKHRVAIDFDLVLDVEGGSRGRMDPSDGLYNNG